MEQPDVVPVMTHGDREQIRQLAAKAQRLYPGPVGDLIARELLIWEEFGWRYSHDSLFGKLMQHLKVQNDSVTKETA